MADGTQLFREQIWNACSAAELLQFSNTHCRRFCIGVGIEGWEDKIKEAIESLQSGIPSPSYMEWEDVSHVLIPFFTSVDLPSCTETETEEFTSIYKFTDKSAYAAEAQAQLVKASSSTCHSASPSPEELEPESWKPPHYDDMMRDLKLFSKAQLTSYGKRWNRFSSNAM